MANPKIIRVYVVRDTATGLYEAGDGYWARPAGKPSYWVPRCTATSRDDATEYCDTDMPEYELPAGWELVKVSEFEAKPKKKG
jgi:uncharacterized protein YbdZ (MbtH family)